MHIIIFNYFLFSDTASANNMDDKQWYHFDDSIVSETREDRLVVSFLNTVRHTQILMTYLIPMHM